MTEKIERLEKHLHDFTVNAACTYFLLTLYNSYRLPRLQELERAKVATVAETDRLEAGKKLGQIYWPKY